MQLIKTTALALALTVMGVNGFAASGEETLESRFNKVKSATFNARIPALAQLFVAEGYFEDKDSAEAAIKGGHTRLTGIKAQIGQAKNLDDLLAKLNLSDKVSVARASDAASSHDDETADSAEEAAPAAPSLVTQLRTLFETLQSANEEEATLEATLKAALTNNQALIDQAFKTLEEAEAAQERAAAQAQRAETLQTQLDNLADADKQIKGLTARVATLRADLEKAREEAEGAKTAVNLAGTEKEEALRKAGAADARVTELAAKIKAAEEALHKTAEEHAKKIQELEKAFAEERAAADGKLAERETELATVRTRLADLENAKADGTADPAELDAAKKALEEIERELVTIQAERDAAQEALKKVTEQLTEAQDSLASAHATYNGSKAILGIEDDHDLTPEALAAKLTDVRNSILGVIPEAGRPEGNVSIMTALDHLADAAAEKAATPDILAKIKKALENDKPGTPNRHQKLADAIRELFNKDKPTA